MEPEVEVPATRLGPRFDAFVAAARRRQRPPGDDPEYDLVRQHLDVAHYLLQRLQQGRRAAIDPVRHFLRQGADARLSPEINFSTDAYLQRHPERGRDGAEHPYVAWLREGRAAGELADPAIGLEKMAGVLGMSSQELAECLAASRSDLQHRLRHGKLGEMFAKAAEIEPLVGDAWAETVRPKLTPLPLAGVAAQVAAMHACHEAAGHASARLLVVAGSGSDGAVTHLTSALSGELDPGDVVVIGTAAGQGGDAGLPEGVRLVDFAGATDGLSPARSHQVLVELIRSLDADLVVGVGSRMLLEALTSYGKALRASERVFLAFDGLEVGPFGNKSGDALRFFYRHCDLVEGFLTADRALVDDLVETYVVPPDLAARIHAGASVGETLVRLLRTGSET